MGKKKGVYKVKYTPWTLRLKTNWITQLIDYLDPEAIVI